MIIIIYIIISLIHFVYMILELRKQSKNPEYETSKRNLIDCAFVGFMSAVLVWATKVAELNGYQSNSIMIYIDYLAMVLAIILLVPLLLRYHFKKI